METNILILSVGTRNKIVQYFRESLQNENGTKKGNVIATDMSKLAPAIYEADRYYLVPSINDTDYINIILDICKKENINGVLSLIDPELSLLAKNIDKFDAIGTKVIGSESNLCDLALDKMKMFTWLTEHGYKTAASYVNKDEFYSDIDSGKISYPVFVKPVKGSASIAITKADNKETVEFLFSNSDNLMIQQFLDGQEIGADVYIDLITGEIVSIFTKKKLKMRAGETDKAVSFKDEKLFSLIKKFVNDIGYAGQIDIDIFEINGEYYISEVNPRFGGGYPHAHESGCNHMTKIINNLQGEVNEAEIGSYDEGIYMMKYNEIMIKRV